MERIALVTGSSRGIGRAIAKKLAAEGYRVCVNYRVRQDCALALAEELQTAGHEAMAVGADVSDPDAVNAMVRQIEERWGPVSLLVNNAGISGQAQIQDVTPQDWRRYFAVNVDGAFYAAQAVLLPMLRAHEGCIINISSMWGLRGASCEVPYSATKAALIGFTRSLAAELAPSHIRVNCVAPGVIDTDMLRCLPADIAPQLEEQTPLGRIGTPEDIARAVAFLAGDGASFITGQVLSVDGGFIL